MYQQFSELPALQLGALRIECFGQRFRSQSTGRDEFRAELRTAAGHEDGVDETRLEVDLGLVALDVRDVEAAGRFLLGEAQQQGGERGRREVALEHARPPSLRRHPDVRISSAK